MGGFSTFACFPLWEREAWATIAGFRPVCEWKVCNAVSGSIDDEARDIAEVPAAKPSIPSVKLAPFDTAVIIKITIGIKTNQAQF